MPKFLPNTPFSLFKSDAYFKKLPKDSEFISQLIKSHIESGGVVAFIYRYKGTFAQERDNFGVKYDTAGTKKSAVDIGTFLGVQDTVLNENRDREYDFDEIPKLTGAYQVSQNELEYARFGLGLANDIITIEFHTKTMEEECGRRLIPGDVIELIHLRDMGVDGRIANKWYEVASITWSPTGYDPMYMRHVHGVILKPLRHQQEFIDLFERTDEYGKTLAQQTSNFDNLMGITKANQKIAREQVDTTGVDTSYIYFDPNDPNATPNLMTDSANPPNGIPIQRGQSFPAEAKNGDYFLRTDFAPNRVYQFLNNFWRLVRIDRKREWQPYNWTEAMRQFMSDHSDEDKERPWVLKNNQDILTNREDRSDPTYDTEINIKKPIEDDD